MSAVFELPNLDDFDANLAADIADFEQAGGDASRPVLSEGYYHALLTAIRGRFGITTKVNKTYPTGAARPYFMLDASFIIDSAIAREVMRQDNNPTAFTGNGSTFLPVFFDVTQFGFGIKDNSQFWYFLGGILASVNLATVVEQEGLKTFTIDAGFLESVFNEKYKDEVKRLYGLAKAGEAISDDEKLNDYSLIPSMLAAYLLQNISDLLTQDEATSRCVVLIARDEYKGEKRHYVKNYILQSKAEDFADQILV
jgi:hypothetical protein